MPLGEALHMNIQLGLAVARVEQLGHLPAEATQQLVEVSQQERVMLATVARLCA